MKMSHQSYRSFLPKHNSLKTSSDRHSSTAKPSSHTANAAHHSKPVCSSSMRTDVPCNSYKVRRLKTRKERNQIRGLEGNRSHPGSQHSRREGGEKALNPLACSRKERPFAKPFLPQKPSIITEGRLTSNRGLFRHEIRSIDIERLVSQQIKRDEQRREQRKQSMMHITSPLPPSVPNSDPDCILDEVREPLQEPENNTSPQLKRKKSSRKEPREINACDFQNNRGVVSRGLTREDGKHDRNANSRKEDTNSKTGQDSPCSPPGETEHVVLSSSENEPVHQLYSTPVETNMNNSDVSQTGNLKAHGEENQENAFMNIMRFEKNSTTVGFPNMEVTQMFENPQTLTSLSDLDSGAGQIGDSVEQGEQMSLSCREAVKRLMTRLCQSSELHVPSRRHPLLAECREALLQTLQKRHSFQLKHNLHRLHSFLNRSQRASQLSSGQRDENCSLSTHAVENKDRCFSRNVDKWTDSAMQQDYLTQGVQQGLDRGDFTKKRSIQEWKTSSNLFALKEPRQSHTDMFDQWRGAMLSQDCSRAQHHHSRQLFNQEQTFTQHAVPVLKSPSWVDHPVDSYFQQQSLSREESLKNIDLDLSRTSHQWREDKDLDLNSYNIYESRKQKPEASFGRSRFWSHQQQVQDERERWAPFSFPASYLSEGFQYKPFFRCPHPSNTQHKYDCPRTNTPDKTITFL